MLNSYEGMVKNNNFGSKMTLIKYNNALDVDVMFENGYIKHNVRKWCFDKGKVYSPYERRVYGVGYLGEGSYEYSYLERKIYKTWKSMLQRGYDCRLKNKYKTYRDVLVCEDWHNFQNFAEWFERNYYEVKNDSVSLDKDILVKGNKLYSPDTSIFVPSRINNLFTRSDKARGKYPIGVTKDGNKYVAMISITKNEIKNRHIIGKYETPLEAFKSYKKYKESLIKEIADEYREEIPKKLYDAMYSYKVDITD